MGARVRSAGRGFTLVEVLVVLVLVGTTLAVSGVVLMPDARQTLRQEAARLALALEHARDEALLTGGAVAWLNHGDGYSFVQRSADGGWRASGTTAYRLPDPVRLSPPQTDAAGAPVPVPLALVGSGTPLRVVLQTEDTRAVVELGTRARVALLDAQ